MVGEFVLVVTGRGCQGIVLYVQDTGFWGYGQGKNGLPLKGVFISLLWSSIFGWDGVL